MFLNKRLASVISAISLLFSFCFAGNVVAAEGGGIEEVIVTAQRTAESIQDVPIAVTALTGEMLEDKGIITPSDLQMSAPNVSFTSKNFGGSSMSIRGIGDLVVSGTGESGVSTHLDEIAVTSNLNVIEYFDVQRLEILRGPQGTLYGRNATGGAINVVTNKPTFDEVEGFLDIEGGDYDNQRIKGALNIPITDNFAVRIAAFDLERDGYIENTADGQVGVDDFRILDPSGTPIDGKGPLKGGSTLANIDDDIDGRDITAYRVTAAWDITEKASVWVQYNNFDEDDDRARITSQICKRSSLPVIGCDPDQFGFDQPNMGSNTGGIIFGQFGVLPPGASGVPGVDGFSYTYPVTETGFRKMHTDFEPSYEYEEDLWTFGFEYEFESFTIGLQGAHQEAEYISRQDYYMDVGPDLLDAGLYGVTSGNVPGGWPESDAAGGPGADFESGPCNYYDGTTGIFGGCILDIDDTRLVVHDQSDGDSESWNVEAKIQSTFDGPFNFIVGGSIYEGEAYGDYYVAANSLDIVGVLAGVYPSVFNVPGNPDEPAETEGYAVFGEMYFDITDRLKLTFGLRYNEDEKFPNDTGAFFTAFQQAKTIFPTLGDTDVLVGLGLLDPAFATNVDGLPNGIARENGSTNLLLGPLIGNALSQNDINIFEFNGVSQSELDAVQGTAAYSAERVALAARVPVIPATNEARFLTGSPQDDTWDAVTGRIGLDWQVNDEMMVYGFYSRGYKPGGFNTPIAPEFQSSSSFTYEEEEIDSIELGAKTTWLDGRLVVNGAIFVYDYTGLQVTRIKNNASLNENIDTDIMGAELEFFWQPEALPNLQIDGSYSYLDTEVDSGTLSFDTLNPTAGDPDFVVLKDIDSGARAATNYVADRTQISDQLISDALVGQACVIGVPCATGSTSPVIGGLTYGAQSDLNGTAVPGTTYPDGLPALFSRSYLGEVGGVTVAEGLQSDIGGNSLPNAPENTIRLGVEYTWNIQAIAGDLTLRWDYYWQDESYAREFNSIGDEIDSWDQHNASIIYRSSNGRWMARAFVRNIEDEDNVTGHYVTSDTSGLFRNYFLTEPRIYGASLRFTFGG